MRAPALWAAAIMAAVPAAGASVENEAALSVTGGSGGYTRVAASVDASAAKGTTRPYGWLELSDDDDARRMSLGAGVWGDVSESVSVKGGVGGSVGRYKDSDLGAGSVTLEAGLESYAQAATLGGEYRLTLGSLADARAAPRTAKEADARGRGRRARGESVERFSVHAWSGYGRVPVGESTLGLRLTVTKPSYSDAILSETASLRVPLAPDWRLTPAVTFEQGAERGVYGSMALSFLF